MTTHNYLTITVTVDISGFTGNLYTEIGVNGLSVQCMLIDHASQKGDVMGKAKVVIKVSDFPQDHPAPEGKCGACWVDSVNRDATVAHLYRKESSNAWIAERFCKPHSQEYLEHDRQAGRTVDHEQRSENSPFGMLTLWFGY